MSALLYFVAVTVLFDQSMYSFSEDAGQSSGISVNLSNPIAQNLFVSILAGKLLIETLFHILYMYSI